MSLTPEQKQAVASWVAAGDNLSAVQRKLVDQFKLSLTYRDVRFLVDDLDLALKDAAPKVDASDVTKATPPPAARRAAPAPAPDVAADEDDISADAPLPDEDELEAPPAGASGVTVNVDAVTLLPGALASGTVTFSDGVTGKWLVDQNGRPGFTEVSQPGYRPNQADAQAFMQQLSAALQQRGML
jgi:hypothetical protein